MHLPPELALPCQVGLKVWCIFGATELSKIAKSIQNSGLIGVERHVANVMVISSTFRCGLSD